MVYTRPDNLQAISVISHYMTNLRKIHGQAVKWILRYLRETDTADIGLTLGRKDDINSTVVIILIQTVRVI